jgi:purine-binding chemotaxis protein CheW
VTLIDGGTRRMLLVTSARRVWALPLAELRETMRPLAIEPIGGAPEFVLGLSVIRGRSVPVIDLARLLDSGQRSSKIKRFVTLKVGERAVALAIEDVLGVEDLDSQLLEELPPLVRDVGSEHVAALGTHDSRLLLVLETARLLPEAMWTALAPAAGVT